MQAKLILVSLFLIELKYNFLFKTTKLFLPKDSATTTGNTISVIASPIANASLPSEGMNYITFTNADSVNQFKH